MGKRKPLPPRVKRMKRQDRLQSAQSWLQTYAGKNLLRGYCNHFAVDWRCATVELKLLGVELDPAYLARREKTETAKIHKRQEQMQQQVAMKNEHWHPYTELMAAYASGDFAALHDLEQTQMADEDPWRQQDDDRRDSLLF